MITIKEIAEMTGVSPTTVQNVIHGRTNKVSKENLERIRSVLRETHYVPRLAHETMTKGRTKIIGVVIYSGRRFEETLAADPFYGQVIGYLEAEIRRAGYYMMLYIESDAEVIFRMVSSWSMAGVIAVSFTEAAFLKLSSMSVECPVVGIDTARRHRSIPNNVGLDDEEGGYRMAGWLIGRGYREIYFVSEPFRRAEDLRLKGYRRALEEAGLPYRDRYVLEFDRMDSKRNGECCAYLVSRKNSRCACLCNSDYIAIRLMGALMQRGIRIPDEIGITGFDDTVYAGTVWPGLTSMHQSVAGKAEEAVKMLLRRMQDGAEGKGQKKEGFPDCGEVLLRAQIVVRGSTL